MLKREHSQGLYSLSSYFWAKTGVMMPMEISQTVLFAVIFYWMVGFQV